VKDFPAENGWWHGLNGHIYFAPVDDESEDQDEPRLFEVTVRSYNEPISPDRTATWAIPVTNEKVLSRTGVCD
jgi:salicylate hydroxylase